MPASKNRNTRKSSGPASFPPCFLPETNQLYTNQDILSAVRMEQSINSELDIRAIAKKLEPLVINKWKEVNPILRLIKPESVIQKIEKLNETARQIKLNKISTKKTAIFHDKF